MSKLKAWRLEVLANGGTEQADLFNKLEKIEMMSQEDSNEEDTYIVCDQLAMAVALNRKLITSSSPKKVIDHNLRFKHCEDYDTGIIRLLWS